MTRGRPKLEPRVSDIILQEANRDRKRDRKDVLTSVVKALKKDGFPLPSHSTILRKISEARRVASNELDAPWSIGTTDKYPLPAGSVDAVLEMYRKWDGSPPLCIPLSIREALWLGRLFTWFPKEIGELRDLAILYAIRERSCGAADQKVYGTADQKVYDTADLDEALRGRVVVWRSKHHPKKAQSSKEVVAGVPKPSRGKKKEAK